MKTVYVLLTRTNTVLSRTIGKTTGDDFTHASLALDAELTRLYSFGRRFEHNPFLAGFVRESLTHGVFSWDDGIPCAVYALNVDDRVYAAVERRIRRMYELRRRYRYNLLGLLYNYAGRAHSRAYRYFCSEFVADTLQRTGALAAEHAARAYASERFCRTSRAPARLSGRDRGLRAGRGHTPRRDLIGGILTEVIDLLNGIVGVLFFVCFSYQFFYILVPYIKKAKPHRDVTYHNYAVLISARNEGGRHIGLSRERPRAELPAGETARVRRRR